jgi:hypothetical protein
MPQKNLSFHKKPYLCTKQNRRREKSGLPAIFIAKGMVAKAAASFNALYPPSGLRHLGEAWDNMRVHEATSALFPSGLLGPVTIQQ